MDNKLIVTLCEAMVQCTLAVMALYYLFNGDDVWISWCVAVFVVNNGVRLRLLHEQIAKESDND